MNQRSAGVTNLMNMSGIPDTMTGIQLESLYQQGMIENYSDDGWLCIHNEWMPLNIGLKRLGETNDYGTCGTQTK